MDINLISAKVSKDSRKKFYHIVYLLFHALLRNRKDIHFIVAVLAGRVINTTMHDNKKLCRLIYCIISIINEISY